MKLLILIMTFLNSVAIASTPAKYKLFLYLDGISEYVMKEIPQKDFFEIKLHEYSCMIAAYDIRPDSSFDRYALKLTDGNVTAVSYGITISTPEVFVGVEIGKAHCWVVSGSES